MSLPMVSRGDSNPMFERATSNLVLFQARNSTEANRRLCRPAHGHSIQPSALIAGFVKSTNQGGSATVDRNDPNYGGLIIAKARRGKVRPYLL